MTVTRSTTNFDTSYYLTYVGGITTNPALFGTTGPAAVFTGTQIGGNPTAGIVIKQAGVFEVEAYVLTDGTQAVNSNNVTVQLSLARYRASGTGSGNLPFCNIQYYNYGATGNLRETYFATDIIDAVPGDVIYAFVGLHQQSGFGSLNLTNTNNTKLNVTYIANNSGVTSTFFEINF